MYLSAQKPPGTIRPSRAGAPFLSEALSAFVLLCPLSFGGKHARAPGKWCPGNWGGEGGMVWMCGGGGFMWRYSVANCVVSKHTLVCQCVVLTYKCHPAPPRQRHSCIRCRSHFTVSSSILGMEGLLYIADIFFYQLLAIYSPFSFSPGCLSATAVFLFLPLPRIWYDEDFTFYNASNCGFSVSFSCKSRNNIWLSMGGAMWLHFMPPQAAQCRSNKSPDAPLLFEKPFPPS